MQDDAFKFAETLSILTTKLPSHTEQKFETIRQGEDDSVITQLNKSTKRNIMYEQHGLPPIIAGHDFPKEYELIKRPVQVGGLFRKGDNVLLTAPSKMGKTWFYSSIATCIASGISFCDRPTQKGRVLLMDLELHKDDAIERLWRIARANNLDAPPSDLMLWPLRSCQYTLDALIECLANRLDDLGELDVIILDPVYMLEGGQGFDENSASHVKNLMVELAKIGSKCGATLCLSHHYRKGKMGHEDHIDRGSGSGAFTRFPDSLISLSKHEENNCAIVEVTGRSMPKALPWVLEMSPPSILNRPDLAPVHKKYGKI